MRVGISRAVPRVASWRRNRSWEGTEDIVPVPYLYEPACPSDHAVTHHSTLRSMRCLIIF